MNLAKIRQVIGWTLIGLLVLWGFLNRTTVQVHFLIFTMEMPLALVIVFSAAAGAGAVYAFRYIKKFKKSESPS
jgi:uncharacterized integral membrane protein